MNIPICDYCYNKDSSKLVEAVDIVPAMTLGLSKEKLPERGICQDHKDQYFPVFETDQRKQRRFTGKKLGRPFKNTGSNGHRKTGQGISQPGSLKFEIEAAAIRKGMPIGDVHRLFKKEHAALLKSGDKEQIREKKMKWVKSL